MSDAQSWNALQISGPVIGPIVLASEITLRAGEQADGFYQVEPLIALGIRLAPVLTIYAGYGSVLNRTDLGSETREARFYQDASIELGKFAGGTLSSSQGGRSRPDSAPSNGASPMGAIRVIVCGLGSNMSGL